MKNQWYILFLLLFSLSACVYNDRDSELTRQKIEANNMNFTSIKHRDFGAIRIGIPVLFSEELYEQFSYKSPASGSLNLSAKNGYSLHFSIDQFTKEEARQICESHKINEPNSKNLLICFTNEFTAVNTGFYLSEMDPIDKYTGKTGWIRTALGDTYSDKVLQLFTVCEYKNHYYLLQLIGFENTISYFHNDFLNIVKSIQ